MFLLKKKFKIGLEYYKIYEKIKYVFFIDSYYKDVY